MKCECTKLHETIYDQGECKNTNIKKYRRDGVEMWLCMDCILPGDELVAGQTMINIDPQLYENWKQARQKMGQENNSEEEFKLWISNKIDEVW